MVDDASVKFNEQRPTIRIDGATMADLSSNLISLLVEETAAGLFRCELCLNNWSQRGERGGYLYFERDTIDFGRELSVAFSAGNQSALGVFRGKIMGLEALYPAGDRPQIVVLAEDRLQDLRMTRRSRSFEQMTDGAIIAAVAQDHGLSVESNLSTILPTHDYVFQANQSDLAFIRERARRINAMIRVTGEILLLLERPGLQEEALQLRYGETLTQFSVLADLAQQRTRLHVTGWDATQKETIDVAAGNEFVQAELLGGFSGSAILYDVFGEREDYVVHQVPLSQAEAQAISISRYLEIARRFVQGTGTASGNPQIRAGSPLDLRGLGKLFDGRYYVTRVQHRFDTQGGYTSDFEVERPAIGRLYEDGQGPYPGTEVDEEPPDNIENPHPGLGQTGGSGGSSKGPTRGEGRR